MKLPSESFFFHNRLSILDPLEGNNIHEKVRSQSFLAKHNLRPDSTNYLRGFWKKTLKINQVKSLKLLIAQVSKMNFNSKKLEIWIERSYFITQKVL